MKALSNIYKYHVPLDQIHVKTNVRLEVFLVQELLHIMIKGDNDILIWFEILTIQKGSNEEDFKSYFYKLVSITGFIPYETIFIIANDEYFFVKKGEIPTENLTPIVSKSKKFNYSTELDNQYTLVYECNTLVKNVLSHVFENVTQMHLVEILTDYVKGIASSDSFYLYVFIMQGKICLILIHGHELNFSVMLDWDQPTDALYHIIHCLQIHHISIENVSVGIGGFITKEGHLYKMLEAYIPKLNKQEFSMFSFLTTLPELIGDHS
jgi:hypothetical protein